MDVINNLLRFLLVGLIATSTSLLHAQDSIYQKRAVRTTDINLLLSFYDQDGVHSAVTGGEGTEKLEVYALDLNTRTTGRAGHSLLVDLGVDIISSASTDNIDFEVSSASVLDQRTHFSAGYELALKNKQRAGARFSYSIESDYTSRGIGIWYQREMRDNTRRAGISFTAFFDDLRWGRLSEPYMVPEKLIYPEELRYKEWFDIHNRYSYNLNVSYEIDLNRRMNLSFYPSFVYQTGLLSTPFHRVYFAQNNDLRVENLPRQRSQGALGTQFNSFLGKRMILRSFYQYYRDDYGLSSHSLKLELPLKLNAKLSLAPFGRIYQQSATRYFRPFAEHNVNQEFYTSDYDLSQFWSGQLGINLRLALIGKGIRRYQPKSVSLRYSYYNRQDGLSAHMMALVFHLQAIKFEKLIRERDADEMN